MPIVPVLPPASTGVGTSSFLSAIAADIAFLLKPPTARLRQIAGQSLTNGVFTAITFTASDVDQDYITATNAGHSNSVNTSRYTAVWPGWYLGTGGASFVVNAAGNRAAYWYVNGTPVNAMESMGASAAAVNFGTAARGELFYLNIGDFAELFAWQSSGGALNTQVAGATGCSANLMWRSN